MALTKSGFKDQNWSHLEGGTNREERRREEEEEEERRSSNKGMELWILYGSHGIVSFI